MSRNISLYIEKVGGRQRLAGSAKPLFFHLTGSNDAKDAQKVKFRRVPRIGCPASGFPVLSDTDPSSHR